MQLSFDFDNEWNFIISEITEKSFDEVGHEKRLVLFFMQILLGRIGMLDEGIEKDILFGKYGELKEKYIFD